MTYSGEGKIARGLLRSKLTKTRMASGTRRGLGVANSYIFVWSSVGKFGTWGKAGILSEPVSDSSSSSPFMSSSRYASL